MTKAALPDKEETVEIESLNGQERKDMIKKLEGQDAKLPDFWFRTGCANPLMWFWNKGWIREGEGEMKWVYWMIIKWCFLLS